MDQILRFDLINEELNLTFPIVNNFETNYISNSIVYLSSEPFHIHGTCKENIIFDDENLLSKIDLTLLSQFQLDASILNRDVNTISKWSVYCEKSKSSAGEQ